MMNAAIDRGGGIIGWTWGVADEEATGSGVDSLGLPEHSTATSFANFLTGVWTGIVNAETDSSKRRSDLERLCGENKNTVDCLKHIVVMTPSLEDAITAHKRSGFPANASVRPAVACVRRLVLNTANIFIAKLTASL